MAWIRSRRGPHARNTAHPDVEEGQKAIDEWEVVNHSTDSTDGRSGHVDTTIIERLWLRRCKCRRDDTRLTDEEKRARIAAILAS